MNGTFTGSLIGGVKYRIKSDLGIMDIIYDVLNYCYYVITPKLPDQGSSPQHHS